MQALGLESNKYDGACVNLFVPFTLNDVRLGLDSEVSASRQDFSYGSCVDGSLSARVNLMFLQIGRVQSCVRPVDAAHMAAGPNAIRRIGSQSRTLTKILFLHMNISKIEIRKSKVW